MGKIITGVEFAILVAIVIGIAILLHVMEARRSINALRKQDDDEQAKKDEADRRRMVHEADSKPCADLEPFCGAGEKLNTSVQKSNAAIREEIMGRWPEPIKLTPDQERRARSRAAILRAQQAARDSMRKP